MDSLKSYVKDVPLKPIKEGESVVLKNIFFDVNKYELKKESVVELNKLTDHINYVSSVKNRFND